MFIIELAYETNSTVEWRAWDGFFKSREDAERILKAYRNNQTTKYRVLRIKEVKDALPLPK